MKKERINWGYLMGRLLLDTACYDASSPLVVDETGCPVDSYSDGELLDGLPLQAQQSYPLASWEDDIADEDEG